MVRHFKCAFSGGTNIYSAFSAFFRLPYSRRQSRQNDHEENLPRLPSASLSVSLVRVEEHGQVQQRCKMIGQAGCAGLDGYGHSLAAAKARSDRMEKHTLRELWPPLQFEILAFGSNPSLRVTFPHIPSSFCNLSMRRFR